MASAQAIPMAFALLARDPSPQALLDAANIGGDTDTIGAIAGAILGAALGFEVFVGRGLAQVELASHLDLPSVALELLELRAAHEPAASAPAASKTEDSSEAASPEEPAPASSPDSVGGRVVLMGQILVDHVLAGAAPVYGGGSDWGNDEGLHVSAGFSVLVAARRMGAEAVSLSPIGTGPHASLITDALAREGIVDVGPRVTDCDNAYRTALVSRNGTCTIIATKGAETMAPENAWADVVRTMKPGDVLFIDGSLMEHPSNKVAADNALRVLPEGVRVVLDVSPVVGIPDGLPSNTIISMNYDESQDLWTRIPEEERKFRSWASADTAASALAAWLGHHVLVRKDESGAYFAPADGTGDLSTFHIPTPRVTTADTNGAGDSHSGVLAACLAQDVELKRALLLANCAGALASTVPGPASCPTRSQIEAAADALSESGD